MIIDVFRPSLDLIANWCIRGRSVRGTEFNLSFECYNVLRVLQRGLNLNIMYEVQFKFKIVDIVA